MAVAARRQDRRRRPRRREPRRLRAGAPGSRRRAGHDLRSVDVAGKVLTDFAATPTPPTRSPCSPTARSSSRAPRSSPAAARTSRSRATTPTARSTRRSARGGKVTTAFGADSRHRLRAAPAGRRQDRRRRRQQPGHQRHRRRLRARPLQHRRHARRQLRQVQRRQGDHRARRVQRPRLDLRAGAADRRGRGAHRRGRRRGGLRGRPLPAERHARRHVRRRRHGKVTALMGSSIGAARAVRVAADGKIVVAGHVSHDFALVRLDAGGRVDAALRRAARRQGRHRRRRRTGTRRRAWRSTATARSSSPAGPTRELLGRQLRRRALPDATAQLDTDVRRHRHR